MVVPLGAIPALEVERRPDLDAGHQRILEGVGQHRDHALTRAVDGQRLTDRIRARAEILAPDALADDDRIRSLALVVVSKRLTGSAARQSRGNSRHPTRSTVTRSGCARSVRSAPSLL